MRLDRTQTGITTYALTSFAKNAGKNWNLIMTELNLLLPTEGYYVQPVPLAWTKPLILKRHYARCVPPITYAFGLFNNGALTGVCTFGSPANFQLCVGICGPEYKSQVIELNRLVLKDNMPNEASRLIGKSLKLLPGNWIVVSYSDTAQGHKGVIYLATNWLFTGMTKERKVHQGDNKHTRHSSHTDPIRIKSAKYRYVTFAGNKRWKRKAYKALNYKEMQ